MDKITSTKSLITTLRNGTGMFIIMPDGKEMLLTNTDIVDAMARAEMSHRLRRLKELVGE